MENLLEQCSLGYIITDIQAQYYVNLAVVGSIKFGCTCSGWDSQYWMIQFTVLQYRNQNKLLPNQTPPRPAVMFVKAKMLLVYPVQLIQTNQSLSVMSCTLLTKQHAIHLLLTLTLFVTIANIMWPAHFQNQASYISMHYHMLARIGSTALQCRHGRMKIGKNRKWPNRIAKK